MVSTLIDFLGGVETGKSGQSMSRNTSFEHGAQALSCHTTLRRLLCLGIPYRSRPRVRARCLANQKGLLCLVALSQSLSLSVIQCNFFDLILL